MAYNFIEESNSTDLGLVDEIHFDDYDVALAHQAQFVHIESIQTWNYEMTRSRNMTDSWNYGNGTIAWKDKARVHPNVLKTTRIS